MDAPENTPEHLPETPDEDSAAASPFDALLRRSALAILTERAWRLFVALATLALAFLALAWFGVWQAAPLPARMVGVALFGFTALYLLGREIARGLPRRSSAITRIDQQADAALRPAASLDDTLAAQKADPDTAALWTLHRKRLEAALEKTPIAPPDPQTPRLDPFAIRAAALIAAVAAAFVAGDEKGARLAAAFDWRALPAPGAVARIDAWLEPPAYTGRPPIVLAQENETVVEAPVNSVLRVRPADAQLSIEGGLTPAIEEGDAKAQPKKEQGYRLGGPAKLGLPDGRRFELSAVPDRAPEISLTDKPRNNARGSMTLAFKAEDDYGVVSAEAVFTRPPGGRRALYEPPRAPLALPLGAAGQGEGKSTVDLADSPYAGAKLSMRLVAKDAAGNEGASAPLELTLPQRRFTKPLARALAEQRRNLALDPEARANVRAALEALSLAPESFDTPSSIHLGLRAARRSLDGPRTDDELRGVADMLWAMALYLEEGDVSQAERDLRAAERELRDAMARGDEKEIAEKSEQLREALDKFLQQLGSRLPKEGEPPRESASNGDTVTPDDLNQMLEEMKQAMQAGDMARAQELLDELQDIMENAQTAQGGSPKNNQRQQKMSKAMNEIDQLSREEQKLRDDTFQGMQQPEESEPDAFMPRRRRGQAQQQNENNSAEHDRQRQLRERLEKQQDALREEGAESEELDEARRAMKEAEQALDKNGEGRGKAVDAQGRAVDALRKGADKLAQQMQGENESAEEGEGQQSGQRGGKRRGHKGRDPFGRETGGKGQAHKPYDPLGLPPAQRAHRVQEELRRRLGQPERPPEELDYLQRLLRR